MPLHSRLENQPIWQKIDAFAQRIEVVAGHAINSARVRIEELLPSKKDAQTALLWTLIATEIGAATGLTAITGSLLLRNLLRSGNPVPVAAAAIDEPPVDSSPPIQKVAFAVPTETPFPTLAPTLAPTIDRPTRVSTAPSPPKESAPPPDKIISQLTVTPEKQSRNLNCEATGAAIIARFHGFSTINADNIMAQLPRSLNPWVGFVGSVDGPKGGGGAAGYGVYLEPVAQTLKAMGVPARFRENISSAEISALLKQGKPVETIATWDLDDVNTATRLTWKDEKGNQVVGFSREHSFVITGETATQYRIINTDPTSNRPLVEWVSKQKLLESMKLFGSQGMWIE